jgi:uncharacterized protein GlcG (DUF336 family)
MQALQAALHEVERASVRVSIAIVDAAGQLIHMAHMDGAPLQSREIAQGKALTAVGFGISTAAWAQRLPRCSAAVQQGLPLQAGVLFGGGEPFLLDGAVVGAIGISGASEQLDGRCALAAANCVSGLLTPA